MSIFDTVKISKKPKSQFNLSHTHKFSAKMGQLYPIMWEEVMPGDSWKLNAELFIRFAPLIAPVMERFYANVHFFFVPNRLVWDEWEDFIGRGETGTANPLHPFFVMNDGNYETNYAVGSLGDYLGVPAGQTTPVAGFTKEISALPFRAYNLIYNEYYRDQNLITEVPIGKNSGQDLTTFTLLQKRAWKKTYFHSALPFAQRGAEVTLPFDDLNYKTISEVKQPSGLPAELGNVASDASGLLTSEVIGVPANARIENIESIGAPTINELRKAYRLQEWLENNARAGARYTEQILSHFGVKSKDSRLQRPEYLGGGQTSVVVSEVLNTTGLAEVSPDDGGVQGRMAGHGISIGRTNSFKRYFTEHGIIMGIFSIMSYPAYWQGVHRKWTRFDWMDYPFPEFANLGEQPIANQEIFLNTQDVDDTLNTATFGYIPRYAEFKTGFNQISGDFRTTLDFWQYGQKYATPPALNKDFMEYNNDNRIWNVVDQTIDNVYVQSQFGIKVMRPLPYYGTPRT